MQRIQKLMKNFRRKEATSKSFNNLKIFIPLEFTKNQLNIFRKRT